MSRRDVEQWLLAAADPLAELGVKGVSGHGPDLGAVGPSSWISFSSDVGCGRVVRGPDGTCHADAHRYADGAVLIDRTSRTTTSDELVAIVRAITPIGRSRLRALA